MTNKKLTIKEAAQKWVGEFNKIPMSLVEKAYPYMEGIEVLANNKECGHCGNEEVEGDTCEDCESDEDIMMNYSLPMWGTLFTFGDSLDNEWITKQENLDKALACGIVVFESDELGVFFGIDGVGYDFYESHWIPFYQERGLKWHSETEESQMIQ